ncbi:NUDIX domain-containing protein [candidate division KSB1 bacterium]|nr:NUDIX domain-containing protein [candidate division KSB1 bacterium]NIR72667.1 NUDIX domain-containing protein [candidate division KSB1 bacterium]NIS25134.1 NUDIX domain-containing protein [candidate division KSB1 bacterium]NIT72041.1 NUDIX domain-containing protein [candidate division KSB1 bacterium]NIU25833.1 NUDIX domain-containing protein [candidate division KSB1 bacterium]
MDFRFCPACGAPLESKSDNDSNARFCPNCDFTHYDHPKPCAGAVIAKNGDILLIRRANEPYKNCWDFPGGFLEFDEHPEDGLIREVSEELDIKIQVSGLIGLYMDHYGSQKESTLNIYYTCNILNGSITPNHEVSEAKWFSLREVPTNFAFKHAKLVLRDWTNRFERVG